MQRSNRRPKRDPRKVVNAVSELTDPCSPRIKRLDQSGRVDMMESQSANQGQYTITFRVGAKRAKDPANQISVNHSLDQSHEGFQALISAGDWVKT